MKSNLQVPTDGTRKFAALCREQLTVDYKLLLPKQNNIHQQEDRKRNEVTYKLELAAQFWDVQKKVSNQNKISLVLILDFVWQ